MAMLFILLLLCLFTIVAAQTICINSGQNYTNTSPYRTNLNTVLPSVSSNINATGFYSASAGRSPYTANAIALCRGDVPLDTCRSCLHNATLDLTSSCPNTKQVAAWREECTLRYSNNTLYGSVMTSPRFFMWNVNNASSPDNFKNGLKTLFDNLVEEAAAGGAMRKVAGGNVTARDEQTIFALVQCTPDLSTEDCRNCLSSAAGDIPNCCGNKIGGRVLLPSCNVRFEIGPFFNQSRLQELAAPLLPPPRVPQPATPVPVPADSATQPLGSNNGNKTWRITMFLSMAISFMTAMIV